MPEDDGLMRVFWPTDLPRSDCNGVVVGWRNSALDVLVVAVLEEVEVCALRVYSWPGMDVDKSADSVIASTC